MTSFVNMFQPARYTCNDKKVVRMFRAVWEVSCLRPVGEAAVVHIADINKGMYTHILSVYIVTHSN
jgi:hypothetical protein